MIQISFTVLPTIKRIDGFFNDARLLLIKNKTNTIFYSAIKIILLGCVSCWAFPSEIDLEFAYSFLLGLFLNLIELCVAFGTILEAKNIQSCIAVAEQMRHCHPQHIQQVDNFNTIQSRVSKTYDFLNLVHQKQQQTSQKLSKVIQSSFGTHTFWISKFSVLCKILGVIFILLITKTLFTSKPTIAIKIVSIVCLIFEIANKIQIIIGLVIFVFLLPFVFLTLLLCCICSCFCAASLRSWLPNNRLFRQQNQQPFNIQDHPQLQPIQFSTTIILQAQSDCKICFQKFQFGDRLLILPCNNKHVFHEFCITTWFRASETCPVCRKSLQQMLTSPIIV